LGNRRGAPLQGAAEVIEIGIQNTCGSVNDFGDSEQRLGSSQEILDVSSAREIELARVTQSVPGVAPQRVEQPKACAALADVRDHQ
jgi:hypothetical protein